MANGKPGDHPLTDILAYQSPVYTPQIDETIRRIARLVPLYQLETMFDWFSLPALPEFERQLSVTLERLLEEAQDRGWELPEE